MSVRSEILRFLLRHCPTITEADYHAIEKDDDEDDEEEEDIAHCMRLQPMQRRKKKEGLDLVLQYPRRLLLLAGHPSLCLPEVLRDLNYSARRGALFLFFHRHHQPPNPPPHPPPLSPSPPSTNTATGATIFWRIRDGPGSKEFIWAIIGFL
eukprot:gene34755-44947_t